MSTKKFISKENLLYVWQKMKLRLTDKVDKVEGKGLSTNDFTDELKTKLLNAGDSSFSGNYDDLTNKPDLTVYANKIESIKVNGTAQEITNKSIDITVATKVSDLTNDSGFQTSSEVSTAINNAIKDIQGISYSIVETLPATGQAGVIYLIANSGANPNIYDEYIYVNEKFEKIGTTDVDLTNYVQDTDLVAITNEEIDEIFAS